MSFTIKSAAMLLAFASISATSFADGFKCQTVDESLNVKVFNQTEPSEGTRNAAIMILSNPEVSFGRKTIATFEADGTLQNEAARYIAKVDQRFSGSNRDGELIGGTKLGQLAKVVLKIDFSYAAPIEDGEEASATVSLFKRNGDRINLDAVCTRYLKGE
ncbi:MAG: hypothetical protein NT027_17875 [Proteobacteria bacterium]|nr:hypothetical protein [Pseudomonadota bacterium]